MADITPITTTVTGTVAMVPITPTVTVGDWFPIGSYVTVRNGSGGSINFTIVTPGNDSYGQARPDIVQAVAAGAARRFGPFPVDLGDGTHSNMVNGICSSITTITLEVTT
jgi:hypothetical protein